MGMNRAARMMIMGGIEKRHDGQPEHRQGYWKGHNANYKDYENYYAKDFNLESAKHWAAGLKNEDGTTGAHWTMEQTNAVAKEHGVKFEHITEYCWWITMNMMYSDYYAVAVKHGCNTPAFYADMAKAFLFDKDAKSPREKISAYFDYIVM